MVTQVQNEKFEAAQDDLNSSTNSRLSSNGTTSRCLFPELACTQNELFSHMEDDLFSASTYTAAQPCTGK